MKLTVVGCGDAFGSGGRLQTSFHVTSGDKTFLIDCGATTLIGMQRLELDPDAVSTIFISHLHGDHFGGLVWWPLHAHYVSRRTAPLTIVGPKGIEARYVAASEALFPNSTTAARDFEMSFVEHEPGKPCDYDGITVTAFEVVHPSGAPPYALRIACDGKVLGFSGDTKWVDSLLPAANGADLFISECFTFSEQSGYHMTWRDIERNIDRLGARRVMLTHMGPDMLEQRSLITDPRVLLAEDGKVLEV